MAKYVVETLREVAWFFGMALSTVKTEWVPAGMPGIPGRGRKKGRYDLPAIFRWYREHYVQSGGVDPIGQQLRVAKLAEQEAKAKERTVRADKAANEVVSRDEYERALNTRSAWWCEVLDRLGPQLAPLLANKSARQVRAIFAKQVRAIRQAAYGGRRSGNRR